MLLCLGFWSGFCLIKGFKILLYTLSASLACRPVAENTEDSIKVASCTCIFPLDSIVSAIIGKFIPKAVFAENEHLVKFLYLALETDNRRYAVGIYFYRLIIFTCQYNYPRHLWQHGYALQRRVGYGVTILGKGGSCYWLTSVFIYDTYHLLGIDVAGSENK